MQIGSFSIAAAITLLGLNTIPAASASDVVFDTTAANAADTPIMLARRDTRDRRPFSGDDDSKDSATVAQSTVSDPSTADGGEMDHSSHGAMDHSSHGTTNSSSRKTTLTHENPDHSTMAHTSHLHRVGMWMFEYRYMRMTMEGMLDGAKPVNPEDLLPPVPTISNPNPSDPYSDFVNADGDRETMVSDDMIMDMHMFMAMYAFTDKVTGMIMFNYLVNEMNMTMQMNDPMMGVMTMPMYMESSGFGDTQVAISYKLDNYLLYDPLLTFQVNIPTGSIDELDTINGGYQPYSMQLGSGSYDFKLSLSFNSKYENWGIGVEGSYLKRMMNEQNYSLGDARRIRTWISYDMHLNAASVTLRGGIDHNDTSSIEGRDERIMENPAYYGDMLTNLKLGVSLGLGRGHTLEFNLATPLHEKVDGYQMKTTETYEFAWQWMF